MSFWRRAGEVVFAVILVALPFFLLRANVRAPGQLNQVDRALLTLARPVQYATAALARGVSSVIGDYVYLVDVKADNDRLAHENARLRQRVRELEGQEGRARRLERLLGLRETVDAEVVSAVVVAKDTTEYFRVAHVTLDKPNVAVRENMPVLAADGAVGKVLRVAGDTVDVQLTIDSGFGVDVVVERTQARGFIRGTGDRSRYALHVEYVQRSDEVNEGDVLVTSGVGCRFPKGVPVGRVTRVEKREFGIYQTVEASPTVDFSRLEEVLVVLTDTRDCDPGAGAVRGRPRR